VNRRSRNAKILGKLLMKKVKGRSFKVDARALLSLGRESIKDNTTALVELVKNSYDADAENVDVEIISGARGLVRIADDGSGMTSTDINKKWLRIGFSEKRKRKVSVKGRRETGEKGIGRLSADRLGSILELRSVTASGRSVGIGVDWDEFDVDGAELGSVEISELTQSQPILPKHGTKNAATGTEIRILNLRQNWSNEDIAALEIELSTLVSASSTSDFSIWLRTNKNEKLRKLASGFEGVAELIFRGEFDGKGALSYKVSERPKKIGSPRRIIDRGTLNFDQLVSGRGYKVGPMKVELSYFLRSAVDLGEFTLSQLREYLNLYGGVRIYRDRVRVKPYGNPMHPEGDWLGLADRKVRNPAGAGRADYRIAPNQLVGAVFIERDSNPDLSDSAAREGLVHGESFASLKSAVFGCVTLLESVYHRRFASRKLSEPPSPRLPTVVEGIKASIEEIKVGLSLADSSKSGDSASTSRLLKESVQKVEALAAQVNIAEKEIEEIASQATVYRGLATVGISAAVFGHETESALSLARASSVLALDAITQSEPDVKECAEELSKAVESIEKVAVWGRFALSRVKKDKRRRTKLDLSRLISTLVKETKPLFTASTISLEQNIKPDLELRAFAMDIEALALNLLTNAYHAVGKTKRNRRVLISLTRVGRGDSKAIQLSVSDSGPGIAQQHLDRIWAPLFSTRVDGLGRPIGTGLGLTIARSIALDLKAVISVEPKGSLGGATFSFLIPDGD
jgi:signal transduction histidine kinase